MTIGLLSERIHCTWVSGKTTNLLVGHSYLPRSTTLSPYPLADLMGDIVTIFSSFVESSRWCCSSSNPFLALNTPGVFPIICLLFMVFLHKPVWILTYLRGSSIYSVLSSLLSHLNCQLSNQEHAIGSMLEESEVDVSHLHLYKE